MAQLNARLQPVHRGDIFEDPLHDALEAKGIGEVTGGGTLLSDEGEVTRCDIEIATTKPISDAVQFVIEELHGFGVPKGSVLLDDTGTEHAFGVAEGLGLYLNGTDLPAEVYANSDVNYVIEEAGRLLGHAGAQLSHWEGPRETALYFYGVAFDEMQQLLQPLLTNYPLCAQCRVERIA